MSRPRLTTRRLMIGMAVLAACLSFGVRADRLRGTAGEELRHLSVRKARGQLAPDHWGAYRRAQQDLEKADFLDSFGLTATITAVILGMMTLYGNRRGRPGMPLGPEDRATSMRDATTW